MQLDKLLHGGDYNPEQWLDRPDILAQDVELMKKAHVNVVTLGVFSWSTIEPQEGEFHLDWLADIIHNLYAHGISTILATPSAARPAWLAQKYPEVRRVRGDRVRELYNRRQNHCYTSPIYREKVAIIDRKLAERFGDDPAVILWHIGNEFGGECHCELCQNAFRAWLQKRYGSLDALNKAWNATFWSHNYTEWSQIESPAPHGENAVQGLALDWKRFVSYQSIDFYKWERDCVRELAPKAEFTVNMMYRFNDINYFDFAKEIDVASWDNYPTWHKPTETIEETALDTAMMHDLYYSLKGKPFLMMESSPSFTNWQPVSKQKRPGIAELSALQAVAHAANDGLVQPVLIGRAEEIKAILAKIGFDESKAEIIDIDDPTECVQKAADLAREGQADCIMKGKIETGALMKVLVNKDHGIRKSDTMSLVGFFESPHYHKVFAITDPALLIYPTLEQKKAMIANAVGAFHALGEENPKVAVIAAVEKVNPKMPETVDADAIKQAGVPGCIVEGPISLDLAMDPESAPIKGYVSPVAGDADLLVMPNIVTANAAAKTITVIGGGRTGGVVLGAKVPVLLVSRAASADDKYMSIVLAALIGSNS